MSKIIKIIYEVTATEASNIINGTQTVLFTPAEMRDKSFPVVALLYSPVFGVFGEASLGVQKNAKATVRRELDIMIDQGFQANECIMQANLPIKGFVWEILKFERYKESLPLSEFHIKTISGSWQYLELTSPKNARKIPLY